MMSIKPAAGEPVVLEFDGRVLELFQHAESNRVHVSLISELVLQTDKKGNHTLDINTENGDSLYETPVDAAMVERVKELITAVERAKAAYRFD